MKILKFTLFIFLIKFVSLNGSIRGPSLPFISGDTFRSCADHIFDETTRDFVSAKVQFGEIIFVNTGYLEEFFKKYHPEVAFPYFLITHNNDIGAPGRFSFYLNDPKLLGWFAENPTVSNHPKLYPIPIGLANRRWPHGNPSTFLKAQFLADNQSRHVLCYLNFSINTYPKERSLVWNLFSKKSWCYVAGIKETYQYLRDLSNSQFVISPRGNGLDCHRTWEALLMGAIPIIKSSELDVLFDDLPVLIIQDWHVISEPFLREKYFEIKSKSYNLEKIYFQYWFDLIHFTTEEIKINHMQTQCCQFSGSFDKYDAF